jgi:hypothetical protein
LSNESFALFDEVEVVDTDAFIIESIDAIMMFPFFTFQTIAVTRIRLYYTTGYYMLQFIAEHPCPKEYVLFMQ